MKFKRWIALLVTAVSLTATSLDVHAQNAPQFGAVAQYQNANSGYSPGPGYGQQGYQSYSSTMPNYPPPAQSFYPAAARADAGSGTQNDKGWVDAFNATPTPQFQQDATKVQIHQKPKDPILDSGITARDLHLLGQHDVAVIVDKSLSMTTSDCPGISTGGGGWQSALTGLIGQSSGFSMGSGLGSRMGMSRWEFVQSQTMALARQTQAIFPRGIMLVLFSSHAKVYRNVDLRQLPSIYADNKPWGSTNTAEALAAPIEDYFQRRDQSGGNVKPLVIAIITDGMPTNPDSLREILIETSRKLRSPNEIRITFLQIGTERKGFQLLEELDHNLVNEGAKFDIVETKTFPQVVQQGLARSLVDAIESAGPAH